MDTREIVAQILSRFLLQHGRHVPPSLSHSITFITRSKTEVQSGSQQASAGQQPPDLLQCHSYSYSYQLPDPSMPLSIASELKRIVHPPLLEVLEQPQPTQPTRHTHQHQHQAPGQGHQVTEIKLVIGPAATSAAPREMVIEPDKPVTLMLTTAEFEPDALAFPMASVSSSTVTSYSFGGGRHRGPAAFSFDAAISTYAKLPPPVSSAASGPSTGTRSQKHSVSTVEDPTLSQQLAPHSAARTPQRSHSDREVLHSDLKPQPLPIAEEPIVPQRNNRPPHQQDELLEANKTTE